MIYVTSSNGALSEALLNIGTDFKMEQDTQGSFQISFTCYPSPNDHGYDLVKTESIITVEGNNFKIKQCNNTIFSKSVTATSTFFENSKKQINGIFEGTHTLTNHLAFALNGSGWTYTIEPAIANTVNVIENLGNSNIIAILNSVLSYHKVEYEILPNNTLRFAKEIGPDNDYQYRYKHNVSSVLLNEDTTNLTTFVRGYGAEGVETTYTSPNATTFGILEAEPVRDTRFEDVSSLLNFIRNSIQDTPTLAIETQIPELTNRAIGERVWLIYEPLNVEMQTRILKQTKVLRNGQLITESVVFGNAVQKSTVDLLVSQQENIVESKKEFRSAIKQTDERITLEVEQLDASVAAIDIKADGINLSVNNRITNEVSAINIRANEIDLSVQNLDARTSSSINVLQNNINLKVDKGGSITDINLSPGNATINADKINLNGAVFVNGSITGSTDINIGRDATIGNTLYLGSQTSASGKGIRFSSGALITGAGSASLRISSANTVIGDGVVDLSQASEVLYGSNAPQARFG